MVKYPTPMDTLHSFSKPDFPPQLPPLSPMGRVPGLNPLHPLTALHSQELQVITINWSLKKLLLTDPIETKYVPAVSVVSAITGFVKW